MVSKRVCGVVIFLIIGRMTICSSDLIESLIIEKNKLTIRINDSLKKRFLVDDFFVEYDEDINLENLPQSIVTLPFVLIIFSTVWASGETYYLDSMDWNVYAGLKKLKKMYKAMYPKTPWEGKLIPRKVVNTPPPAQMVDENSHVALLFSGGLDSTVSSLHHRNRKQLLISAWGQYDFPLNNPELWNVARKRFETFGASYGHTHSFIRSNYSEFINHDVMELFSPEIPRWRMYTIEDVGWAGLTAPILYTKGYSLLLIASSDTWAFGYPSAANPFIDSTMNFAGIRLEHDLFDHSRFDKLEYLLELCRNENIKKPFLTVCQQRGIESCNDCGKCRATIMGLFALGEKPEDYGFNTTLQEMRPRVEESFKTGIKSLTTFERFSHIQNNVRQRLALGDSSAKDLEWLISLDLSQFINEIYEKKMQSRFPWRKLHEICPEVEVPEYYLNPDNPHPLLDAQKPSDHPTGIMRSIRECYAMLMANG